MPLNNREPRENGEKGMPRAVYCLGLQPQELSGERKEKYKFIVWVQIYKITNERIRYQIKELNYEKNLTLQLGLDKVMPVHWDLKYFSSGVLAQKWRRHLTPSRSGGAIPCFLCLPFGLCSIHNAGLSLLFGGVERLFHSGYGRLMPGILLA